jgi:hypothetical protein
VFQLYTADDSGNLGDRVLQIGRGTGNTVADWTFEYRNSFNSYDVANSLWAFSIKPDGSGNENFSVNGINGSWPLTVFGNAGVVGNIMSDAAGKGFQTKEGSNCKQGTATLNGTSAVVISDTAVTANSRIFLTIESPGGTVGAPYVSATSAGTSFSIKSTNAADTSTVAYEIFEPAP